MSGMQQQPPLPKPVPPLPPCHKGNVLVFSTQGVEVYGGGWSRGADALVVDTIIDLAGEYKQPTFPSWITAQDEYNVVHLPILDFGAPPMTARFWRVLWSDLVERGGSVLVACRGGHGRTGTVLAALALSAGVVPEGADPVAWVRGRYCQQAVECWEQIEYIALRFGVDVAAGPAPYQYAAIGGAGGQQNKAAADYLQGWDDSPEAEDDWPVRSWYDSKWGRSLE